MLLDMVGEESALPGRGSTKTSTVVSDFYKENP
jgi:hypothetical protein